MILPRSYYSHPDPVFLAKDLLGKLLCTRIDGVLTKGIICETEAYCGVTDKASHAYGDLKSNRTKTMYEAGGIAYVYLCYGIHHLVNVVTNVKGIPHAVLIRGIKPYEGIDTIKVRRGVKKFDDKSVIGPGKVSQALGIKTLHDAEPLDKKLIWIEDAGIKVPKKLISIGPRIGVDYAGEDAKLPYRFWINDLSKI